MGDFTERGADSLTLKVRHQNANSLRTSVGGRVAYTWNVTDQIMIIPEGRMSWQHEFLQYPRTISSALDAGTCPWFTYSTASPNRDAVFVGAGLIVQLGRHLNLNAYYNADFGRKDYVAHMVSGGVNVEF